MRRKTNRCYFCGKTRLRDAYDEHLCLRHRLLLSCKLLSFMARRRSLTWRSAHVLIIQEFYPPQWVRKDVSPMSPVFICALFLAGCVLLALLRRYLWCTRSSTLRCIWCWQALRIRQWYPAQWSSSMCRYHFHRQKARLSKRRQATASLCQSAGKIG